MYAVEDDPYCYPGTSTLRNLLGITDPEELESVETELTEARSDEPLPAGTLDEAHFRAIHHHLFRDLYDWAGETRMVRMTKGSSPFCYPEFIDAMLAKLFDELAKLDHLRGLDVDDFVARAAHFLSELNVIHTFREGNGRAQLTYMFLLAEEAGYPFDSEKLEPDTMLAAMIAAFDGDEAPLRGVLRSLLPPSH